MDAATVADAGYRGLMRGKSVVIPGAANRLFAAMARWMPGRITLESIMRLHQRRK